MDIEKLKYHLENTPIEKLRKEWDEIKHQQKEIESQAKEIERIKEYYEYYVPFKKKYEDALELIKAHKGISEGKSMVIQGLEKQIKELNK